MAGVFFAGNNQGGLRNRAASLILHRPSRSFLLAALSALLLAPGVALAWHLQTAGSGAATTNAFPKQSSATTIDAGRAESAAEPTEPVAAPQDSTQFSANVHASGDTSVRVNGQSIPVPENGSTQTTVNGNGTTQVDVNVRSETNNSNSSASSTFINLNTSSESTIGSEDSTE